MNASIEAAVWRAKTNKVFCSSRAHPNEQDVDEECARDGGQSGIKTMVRFKSSIYSYPEERRQQANVVIVFVVSVITSSSSS